MVAIFIRALFVISIILTVLKLFLVSNLDWNPLLIYV